MTLTEVKAIRTFRKAHSNVGLTTSVFNSDYKIPRGIEYGFDGGSFGVIVCFSEYYVHDM